ncbi:hypothetical protein AAMO2058_001331400 [Amorphochlora amoebiformis]
MAGRSSCLRDFGGEGSKTWEIRALFWVLIYCLLCLQTGSRVGARCPLSSAQRIRKSISGSGSRAVGGTDKMVGTPPDGVVWVSRAVGTRRGGVLGRIREARRALGFGLRGGRGTFDAAGTDPATPVMDASAVASSSEGGEAYRRVDAGGALGYHTSSRRQSRRPSRTTLASISSRASRASQFSPSPQKIHNPHLTPVNQGSGQDDPTPPEFSKKYPSKPSPSPSSTGVRSNEHVVIIGGGLAGLSVALHLLKMDPAINLQIWDENPEVGVGGASAAAAGLIHPFNPRGGKLWMGDLAFDKAIALIKHVEREAGVGVFSDGRAVSDTSSVSVAVSDTSSVPFAKTPTNTSNENRGPSEFPSHSPNVTERQRNRREVASGILRLALNPKQERDYRKASEKFPDEAVFLEPSEVFSMHLNAPNDTRGGLHIKDARSVEPPRYLRAMWKACQKTNRVSWAHKKISDVNKDTFLDAKKEGLLIGHVVICIGAGVCGLSGLPFHLPITPCRGQNVLFEIAEGQDSRDYPTAPIDTKGERATGAMGVPAKDFPARSQMDIPVISGRYLVPLLSRNSDDDGNNHYGYRLLGGATFENDGNPFREPSQERAVQDLEPHLKKLYPSLFKSHVAVKAIAGVRALPDRTENGSIPLTLRSNHLCA